MSEPKSLRSRRLAVLRSLLLAVGLLVLGGSLSGCIIEEGHHCGYWHRC